MSPRNIVLIGFMGAGKSAVGAALAAASGRALIDTDVVVERATGRPIAQLFAEEGEAAFRAHESHAVAEAAVQTGSVIACGGGAILPLRNYTALRETGDIVYLRAAPDALRARLGDDSTRPLLADPAAFERLLSERTPAYEAAADLVVDTDGRDPHDIADEILARLGVAAGS